MPPTERISLLGAMHRRRRDMPVTVTLLGINVLVFSLMAAASGNFLHFPPAVSLQWGANFGPATQDGGWWRLFSALFVHLGLVHLAVNMWALWDIGRLLEGLLGRWRFAALYLGAGVAGNVVSLALQDPPRVSSGASAAIFGLYGALIAFLWRERARIDPEDFRWVAVFAIAFSALMLVAGLFLPSIDNAAHGGGLVYGLVLGLVPGAAAGGLQTSTGSTRFLASCVLSMGVLGAVLLGLSRPPYRYSEELATRTAMQGFLEDDRRIRARWQTLVEPRSGQSFDQIAGALETQVVDSYQHSFDALASVDGLNRVPSHNALLQMQSYAQARQAEALRAAQAFRSAGAQQNSDP